MNKHQNKSSSTTSTSTTQLENDQTQEVHRLSSTLISIATSLHHSTQYPILPQRLTHPHTFIYPLGSLDAKKDLLRSLKEMMENGVQQKSIDEAAVTHFTRCVYAKRGGSIVYKDKDINVGVHPKDFQKR